MGFEPTTTGITIRDSTAELQPPSRTPWAVGAPDRIRTCYPRLRRPVLYPDELRAHSESNPRWSGWRDSNPRHLAPKASALPDCATPRVHRIIDGPYCEVDSAGVGGGVSSRLAGASRSAFLERRTRRLSSASSTFTFTIWPSFR